MNMKLMNKKDLAICILSCIATSLSIIITIMVSVLTGDALDLAGMGKLKEVIRVCFIIFSITVLNNLLFTWSVYLNTTFSSTMSVKVKNKLLTSLLKNGICRFRKKDDAYYMNLFTNDVENIAENYYGYISVFLKFVVLFVGTVVAMAMVQPWLLVVSIVFSLIPLGFSYLFEKENQRRTVRVSDANEKLQGELMQFIHSYEMLKINNMDVDKAVEKIDRVGKGYALANRNQVSYSSLTYSTLDTISNLGNLILIGLGGYWITTGTITVGELVSCMLMADYIVGSTNGLLQVKVQMKAVKEIRKKIEAGMKTEEEKEKLLVEETESVDKNLKKGDILYRNVSFRYSSDNEEETKEFLIENRSVLFENGKCYAVIGDSGAGKSTFIKLMLKYNTDYLGQILYNGKEIREYEDRELYDNIGYLNQNESILNESMQDNITLFSETDTGKVEYDSILRKLNLKELAARVGNGKLGDFGEMISGGEKQRIALARVLLRNPKVLILDEPMTGLDVENQKILNDVVFSLDDVTRIIITHDRSEEYLEQFDEIIKF